MSSPIIPFALIWVAFVISEFTRAYWKGRSGSLPAIAFGCVFVSALITGLLYGLYRLSGNMMLALALGGFALFATTAQAYRHRIKR